MSERGQKMICLGVEGVTYDVIDGKYVVKEEVEDLNQKDRAEYDRIYGADDAYWMFQNNVMQNQWIQKDDELQGALMEWAKPYTHYVSQYDMFFESDSPYANIFMNIEHEWGKTLPILLLSKSEEEFDEYLHKYRETKYELGYEKLLGEFTRKMEEAKYKLELKVLFICHSGT